MTALLRGPLGAEARGALAALSARYLRLRPSALGDLSLADGLAGVALAHAALDGVFPGAGHAARAERALAEAISRVGAGRVDPGLWLGLAGLGFASAQLVDPGGPDGALFAPIDAALGEVVTGLDRFDLVHGLTGVGVYALERLPAEGGRRLLAAVVARLAERASAVRDGTAWRSDARWIACDADVPEHYAWGLGVAHGTPGVIAFLGRVAGAKVDPATRATARALLDGAVAWLLAHELPVDAAGAFGYHAGGPQVAARVAWCNGDPGIAAALLVAARGARRASWRRAALRIGLRAAARPVEEAGVVDAGLCHGAAGVAHIFHRLHVETRDPRLAAAARRWFAHGLGLRGARGFAGFRALDPDERHQLAWRSAPGLLTGAAGVTLALVAATTGGAATWDRALLVS